MEKRRLKIMFNKNGGGFQTNRIALPVPWIKSMGFTENDNIAIVEFDNKKITIKKEELKMDRFEIIEKMFEKLGVTISGKEIWDEIENDLDANGKSNGNFEIELGKFGDDRQLYFAEVSTKTTYNESDDTYFRDINLLSIKNSEKVIYITDIEA